MALFVVLTERLARVKQSFDRDLYMSSKAVNRLLASFALFALVVTQATHAGFRPSFSLDMCAWDSTHIAVVSVTPDDGVFRVIESLKGDLKIGETVTVPDLRPAVGAVSISRYVPSQPFDHTDEQGISGRIPRQPIGSQIVLFLKEVQEGNLPEQGKTLQRGRQWQPASLYGGMKVSAVWIDGGHVFCFQQPQNPGPSRLRLCRERDQLSLPTLTTRTKDIVRTQDKLVRALRLEDRNTRIEELTAIAYGDVWYGARQGAVQGLGKAGPTALPAIQKILRRPPVPYDMRYIMGAVVEAAGPDAGNELARMLEQDLKFWRTEGPNLTNGWWNQDPTPEAPLRLKYDETIEVIRALDLLRYRPASRAAAELRDFWVSLPQLNDPSGLNQMAQECGLLVKHLSDQ